MIPRNILPSGKIQIQVIRFSELIAIPITPVHSGMQPGLRFLDPVLMRRPENIFGSMIREFIGVISGETTILTQDNLAHIRTMALVRLQ